MDRTPDHALSSESPTAGGGLGPVGDLIGGQWPVQAADRIESVIDSVRRKTTGPAMVASRALVYGIVGSVFVVSAAILTLIAVLRGLDALLPTWLVQLIVGGILCLGGIVCWSQRRPKENPS